MARPSFKEIAIFHGVVIAILAVGYFIYENTNNIIVLCISIITYIVWGLKLGIQISIAEQRKKDMIKNPYKYIKPNEAAKERIYNHFQKTHMPGLPKELQPKLKEMVFESIDENTEKDKK